MMTRTASRSNITMSSTSRARAMIIIRCVVVVAYCVLAASTSSIHAFQLPLQHHHHHATQHLVGQATKKTRSDRLLSPHHHQPAPPPLHMIVDPSIIMDTAAAASVSSASTADMLLPSLLTSFADQGQNLAGIFFQASLLPYLLFLYFLSYRANRISAWSNFGFQYVLLFVFATIPSGILSKNVYGTTLANVDWLHGGAESLLTLANIFIVRDVIVTTLFIDLSISFVLEDIIVDSSAFSQLFLSTQTRHRFWALKKT
jgi:Protein of unknown function (DUF3593)